MKNLKIGNVEPMKSVGTLLVLFLMATSFSFLSCVETEPGQIDDSEIVIDIDEQTSDEEDVSDGELDLMIAPPVLWCTGDRGDKGCPCSKSSCVEGLTCVKLIDQANVGRCLPVCDYDDGEQPRIGESVEAYWPAGDMCVSCSPCEEFLGAGETGRRWPLAQNGSCLCETEEGYYQTGWRPEACDKDGDGWVNQTARTYLEDESDDPVKSPFLANAKCGLKEINRFVLVNEYGQERTIKLTKAVAMFEPPATDDEEDAAFPGDVYGGLSFDPVDLNPMTKACVNDRADFNANGISDIVEWNNHKAIKKMDDRYRFFAQFSYFMEAYWGEYVQDNGEDMPGAYYIHEKSRSTGGLAARTPFHYQASDNNHGWRQCPRYPDSAFNPSRPPSTNITLGFAQYYPYYTKVNETTYADPVSNINGDSVDVPFWISSRWGKPSWKLFPFPELDITIDGAQWLGMTHSSQFKCIQVVTEDAIDREFAPQKMLLDDLENKRSPRVLNACELTGKAANKFGPGFSCDIIDNPSIANVGGAYWGLSATPAYDQLSVTERSYSRGCINQCYETRGYCGQCGLGYYECSGEASYCGAPGTLAPGLLYRVYNGTSMSGDPVCQDISTDINNNWGAEGPCGLTDDFSVKWTAQIKAASSGLKSFNTTSDDGVRLWIDGNLIISNWTDHTSTANSGSFEMEADRLYSLEYEYYDRADDAVAQLVLPKDVSVFVGKTTWDCDEYGGLPSSCINPQMPDGWALDQVVCNDRIPGSTFIYVSSTDGSDTEHPERGSRQRPFKTIQAAIDKAAGLGGPRAVIVSSGTYLEFITLADGVSIYGGYTGKDVDGDYKLDWYRYPTEKTIISQGLQRDELPGFISVVDVRNIISQTILDGLIISASAEEPGNVIALYNSLPAQLELQSVTLVEKNDMVYLSSTASAGRSGAADDPVKTMAEAYAKSKQLGNAPIIVDNNGTYSISGSIEPGIHFRGGYVYSNGGWSKDFSNYPTFIPDSGSPNIGLFAENIDVPTNVSHLKIEVPDNLTTSGSNYGIVTNNCSDLLQFTELIVNVGNAGGGANGGNGANGVSGGNGSTNAGGSSSADVGGTGAGYADLCGADGYCSGKAGAKSSGNSSDAINGKGGTACNASNASLVAGNGGAGVKGSEGNHGQGGVNQISIDSWGWLDPNIAGDGSNGTNGSSGTAGGGGGGGCAYRASQTVFSGWGTSVDCSATAYCPGWPSTPSGYYYTGYGNVRSNGNCSGWAQFWDTDWHQCGFDSYYRQDINGERGGGGGGAGSLGYGGGGGRGGGGAFGFYNRSDSAATPTIINSSFTVGNGGNGGSGGSGGSGGAGGTGGGATGSGRHRSGAGGKGGSGGSGGEGGGGSGGPSYCFFSAYTWPVNIDDTTTCAHGSAASGGAGYVGAIGSISVDFSGAAGKTGVNNWDAN